MSAPIPPNPCLLAILLVVRSNEGPRFVFHYPLNPGNDTTSSYNPYYGAHDHTPENSSSDSEPDWSSEESGLLQRGELRSHTLRDADTKQKYKRFRDHDEDEDNYLNSDSELSEGDEDQGQPKRPPWETVLGYGTEELGTLLCPLRAFHKKRFELTLDDLVFLGWPIFARDDGSWRKKRDKRRKKSSADNSAELEDEGTVPGKVVAVRRTDLEVTEELEETSGHDTPVEELANSATKGKVIIQDGENTVTTKKKDTMTMFNVVFVMNPPALEHQLRVRQMYEHVVKKFSSALKWEQARSDYVWKESKPIIKARRKAKESSAFLRSCSLPNSTDTRPRNTHLDAMESDTLTVESRKSNLRPLLEYLQVQHCPSPTLSPPQPLHTDPHPNTHVHRPNTHNAADTRPLAHHRDVSS